MLGLRYTFLHDPARQWLSDGTLDWLWAEAEQAGVPIAMLATDSLADIGRIAERHPGLRLTIDHLGGRGGLTTLKDAAAMTHMPQLVALAKFPNVAVKATGAPGYSAEAYPFPTMQTYLRQIYDAFGPHRDVLGHRHHQDAVLLAAMRDDVHRGTAVAERGGQATDHGRRVVRLVGLEQRGAMTMSSKYERASRSAVVVGATSKWQSDGRNTKLAHGQALDDSAIPVGARWGVGGAIAQKFAQEGMLRRADDAHRGQCHGAGGGHPRTGRRVHRSSSWICRRRTRSRRRSRRSAAMPAIRTC